MAEAFNMDEWAKNFKPSGWTDDEGNFVRDFGSWGFGMEFAYNQSSPEMVKAMTDEYGGFYKAPQHMAGYLQSSVGRNANIDDYKKAISAAKNDPSIYYKNIIESAAYEYGRMKSMGDYFGGYENADAQLKDLIKEAEKKNINISGWENDLNTKFSSGYASQSGYNNPDLRSSNGLFGQTLGRITSNPISTLLFPVAAAGAMGAFSAAGAGGTDYLGSQALGDASTGAVGSGSTGFGINAGASGVGINAGTGSLLATAPVDSGFGISTTPPAGNFGEFNPNIGSGTTGSSGIGIDTGAATEGYLGTGSATDAASTSGLGYLGGADALPTGTAGITTNVAADTGVSTSDVLRGVNAVKSLLASPEVPQQPTGNKSFVPKGNVNYDPLLNLLTMRASTPNLLSLLG